MKDEPANVVRKAKIDEIEKVKLDKFRKSKSFFYQITAHVTWDKKKPFFEEEY